MTTLDPSHPAVRRPALAAPALPAALLPGLAVLGVLAVLALLVLAFGAVGPAVVVAGLLSGSSTLAITTGVGL